MTRYKPKMLLSLLLALVMIVTMLPMTALAADDTELAEAQTEGTCTEENCTHEHEPADETESSDVYDTQSDTEITETEAPVVTNEVPVAESPEVPDEAYDSGFEWDFDADCGELFIYGSGAPETFTSADDQPWAAFRENIVAVHMDDYEGLTVDSIAYWFSGCVNLEYVEIAASVREIGYHAFYDCKALQNLVFFHEGAFPTLVQGAFTTNQPIDWTKGYDPRLHITVMEDWMLDNICAFDWGADDCPVTASNDYGGAATYAQTAVTLAATRAVGYCSYCKTTCAYTEAYEQWTASVHCHRLWCSNCGYDQAGGVLGESHVFSHYNSSYDRCSYCGYLTACTHVTVCYHNSTYTTWSGCDWYEYCRNCGVLVDSGTSHGTYSYGAWEYYNASHHRRYYSCNDCGEGSYTYGNHSTTTQYGQYSSTQHSVRSYCSTCGSYVGSTSYANHSFTYGAWQPYSATQHRRLKTCSVCGYSEYEYSSHSLSYGSWTNYSASQHRRTVSCSTCGYSSYEYANHALTSAAWASISDTQHRRTLSCSCGYSTTETASHSLVYGDWTAISDTQHQRTITCSGCSYNNTDTGNHTDADGDGYCDDCGYAMTRFSVTVPASLTMTVSKHGEVYTSDNAIIVNNSTGAVEVTAVTVSAANGWTIVPYNTGMATEKVDAKFIGFSLNNAQSSSTGSSEALSLLGAWSIPSGSSLPLSYDAVVSAISEPVNEQVLTVVFVLDWA